MSSQTPELLQVRQASMVFGGLVAVQSLELTVARGEILALMGPNGAGKTTCFNMIAGALTPTRGSILLDGRDITRSRPDQRCRLGLARTFQITQPFHELSVVENVMVGALSHHTRLRTAREEAAHYVEQVGLAEKATAAAKQLSTGQRKRLELARALATRPRLLLMDEVTGGVDQKSIPGLVELVRRLHAGGLTLIVIEHNMRVVGELAERAVFMNRGAVIAEGGPEEIAEHPEVVELYLGAAAHA